MQVMFFFDADFMDNQEWAFQKFHSSIKKRESIKLVDKSISYDILPTTLCNCTNKRYNTHKYNENVGI